MPNTDRILMQIPPGAHRVLAKVGEAVWNARARIICTHASKSVQQPVHYIWCHMRQG